MRTERGQDVERKPSRKQEQSFKEVLRLAVDKGRSHTLRTHPNASRSPAVAALPRQTLATARVGMNAEAKRLTSVRAEALTTNEEEMSARLVDMLCREMVQELVHGSPAPSTETPLRPFATDTRRDPAGHRAEPNAVGQVGARADSAAHRAEAAEARAAEVHELVERIALFVKSSRPALSLTVGGGLSAEVDVERTGVNEVALNVRGRQGPPRPDDLSRLREEMASRGLRLSSLSVS
jgi:hypothetical protein